MRRYCFIILLLAFVLATASAVWAQAFVVETGRPAELAVVPLNGATYHWEFFCEISGESVDNWLECTSEELVLVDNARNKPAVVVMFSSEGTYYFRVTIINEEGCTNYKIGKIEVFDDPGSRKIVVAGDDRYKVGCELFVGNVLDNDTYTDDGVYIYLLTIPVHGYFNLDESGQFFFDPPENFVGVDSLRYMICGSTQNTECDVATVYFEINSRAGCGERYSSQSGFFIPEGFSPNSDGINDCFKITGIEEYPDAKLSIYTRQGHKIFEKEKYGNLNYWADEREALWWGNVENASGKTERRVSAGNYIYILLLDKNTIKKGTVMVSY